ncbi:MAG: hypothetical protein KatS3mg087_1627 [Patescibacteria group bacterium]|nr:MAG: hypothetical protein KatS3mg087_1627 [Patescibacteria group bacterium]
MKDEEQIERVVQAYKDLFSTPNGLIVLEDLKELCCYNKPTYTDNIHDMLIKEGARQMLLYIMETSGLINKGV